MVFFNKQWLIQKQPPEVFCKKSVFRNFPKFTGKHLYLSLFFNKVAGLRPQPATLLKKRLWHRWFPVNFAKFLRTPFLQNTSGRLLPLIKFCENPKSNSYVNAETDTEAWSKFLLARKKFWKL